MAKEMLPCPVAGCDRRRSSEFMMCRPDWWRVSPPTRSAVYDAWDSWGGFANDDGEARSAYLEIRDIAIGEAEASRARAAARA